MCGIFCLLTTTTYKYEHLINVFKHNISRRGPDCQDTKKWSIGKDIQLYFMASVLWMQGEQVVPQPIENPESFFLYNGNIYGGISEEKKAAVGDTSIILEQIQKSDNILEVVSKLQGPFSFIYLNKLKKILYFGRDCFGRNSLLIGINDKSVVLASVAKKGLDFNFTEIPSIGIFCWDLQSNELSLLPYDLRNPQLVKNVENLNIFLKKIINVKENLHYRFCTEYFEPEVPELFFLREKNLKNVEVFEFLLREPKWRNNVMQLKNLLKLSVEKRIKAQPKHCKNCIKEMAVCSHSQIGILFSGGVDCAVIAVLSHMLVDKSIPIDLLNVSFNEVSNYDSPDRQTGLETLNELRNICSDRDWNFLKINVSQQELNELRKNHIADLIYPLQTVLDDSLGCALWFASRGSTKTYTSPSRVLLAGMGADELFGGYTKHRAAFKRGSWKALHEALNEDWQNLPYRNHARDNRVVCDHGRELRIPYLDENVVEFVRGLPSWEKTCPSDQLPQGFGEKLLLRTLAFHLGLKNTSFLKKRALQFGSRIANKKENAREISERLL